MSTRTAFDRVFDFAPRSRAVAGWAAVATALHVGGALAIARRATAAPVREPTLEVVLTPDLTPDLEPIEPPPAHEEPELPAKEEAPPAPVAPAAPPAAPKPAAPPPVAPPPAAKAGEVLTAKDDAPKGEDEPVSFVSDPNGSTWGHGVVAKGGTADVGAKGAAAAGTGTTPIAPIATAKPLAPPTQPQPATNLSRKPTLSDPNACKGFFPSGADDDEGAVTLRVVVRVDGSVASANVVKESPSGQGFGASARACLLARTFSPGLDPEGRPTLAAATVVVRFSR